MRKSFARFLLAVLVFTGIASRADSGTDWGGWSSVSGWPGLNYRVHRDSSSPGDRSFTWWVEFENTYNQQISFSFNLTPPGSQGSFVDADRMILKPGSTHSDWFSVASHDGVIVWCGNIAFGDGSTAPTTSSPQSSAQSALQQQQAQLQQQQQAAQERQQQLQQQQAALQQQIVEKKAALEQQQQALQAKRQQIIDRYTAKAQTYTAIGNAVQNAANQVADMLQQQEQQREADEAKREEQEQKDELEREQRNLQNQLDQLQQQVSDANSAQSVAYDPPQNQPQSYNPPTPALTSLPTPKIQRGSSSEELLQKAKQGDADAENKQGILCQNVKRDYVQAVDWYRKAADQGNADAQYNLAVMYKGGWGVVKDKDLALAWYQKSAAQGNQSAKYALSKFIQTK